MALIKLKEALSQIVEKYTAGQLRDRNGKFAEMGAGGSGGGGAGGAGGGGGGGGGGGSGSGPNYTHPTTATVKRMTVAEFGKNAGDSGHNKTARAIVIGAINGPKGEGSSLGQIYASVSHATGIPQGTALALAVNGHLKQMDREGQLSVKLEKTVLRHGEDKGAKAGKVMWTRNEDGDWAAKSIETYRISVPDKKLAATGSNIKSPHTLGPRAARFDPAAGGLADRALEFRRKEYSDTRLAPQGRYHSADRSSPEMMYGDSRQKLLKAGKISAKEAQDKEGSPIGADKDGKGGKFVRTEVFEGKKNISFYDATSSVTAHIGVMTGDKNSLEMSALLERPAGWKPKHHEVAKAIGIDSKDTGKPYYTVLSGSKGSLTKSDFEGFDSSKGSIKVASKAIWTAGSYGSKPQFGIPKGKDQAMGNKVMDELVKGGMKPELAKQTAQKMLNNFKETSLANFTPGFKKIIAEAPENFVYENPMSGYRMSFNNYDTKRMTLVLGQGAGGKGSSSLIAGKVRVQTDVPTTVNSNKTRSGSAALFVQNWDSAVMSDLMLKNRSPHTVHDAIGINKSRLKSLQESVANSMAAAQKYEPLEDLAKQIMKQHKKNKTPQQTLDKHQKDLEKALKQLRKSQEKFKFQKNNNHFVYED
jgi:hypothetical protein